MSFTIDPKGVETGVVNHLIDFAGQRVLEVGCGDGRLTWRFADEAASVLAIDVNEQRIEAAKSALPNHLASKVRFEVGDMTTARFSPGSFDVAVLSYSL